MSRFQHPRLCAWLHIASGLALMLLLCAVLVFLALNYGTSSVPAAIKARLGAASVAIGTATCLVAGLELIGGVAFLSGKTIGRPLLLLSSAFHLINLPLGTALGVYTFWALFRAPAVEAAG